MFGLSPSALRSAAFILVYSMAIGVLVSLSSYHTNLNPDTLVVYLESLVRWTPFFWSQDRYGMLIPALTQWARDPLLNLVLQNTLHIMTSLITFFLLARYLFPARRWLEIGMAASLVFVALSGWGDLADFLTPWQIYTPAIMLGVAALILAERQIFLALLLMILAHWCNFSVGIFLGILLIARSAEQVGRHGWVHARLPFLFQGGLLAVGYAAGHFIRMPYMTKQSEGYSALPPDEALVGWVRFLHDYLISPRSALALLIVPALAGLVIVYYVHRREPKRFAEERDTIRAFFVGQFTLFAYIMLAGASVFAKWNGFPKRYLIPSLILWTICWSGLSIQLLPALDKRLRQLAMASGFVVMAALMVIRFGYPSVENVKRSVAQSLAPRYLALDAECTHVAGDYYRTWPAMYYSRFIGARPLWAISYRSEVTRDLWRLDRFQDARICYWEDNEREALSYLRDFRVHGFTEAVHKDGIVILSRPAKGGLPPAQASR